MKKGGNKMKSHQGEEFTYLRNLLGETLSDERVGSRKRIINEALLDGPENEKETREKTQE